MAKKILVSYNFLGNQIENALVHVLATAPTALAAGQIYYDSVENRVRWYDGSSWNSLYTINDAGTATNDLWSADKIQTAIDNAVSGGVTYKGGYDAATNSPDLDSSPSGVLKGDMYTVTVAGTFFTEQVEVGDVLIAEIDNATTLANWTVVERNLNTATETSEGTVRLATQAEVDAGTAGALAVTPDKFQQGITNLGLPKKFAVDLDGAGEASVTRVFAGGRTTWTITHNLNSLDVQTEVKEISTGETVGTDVVENTANSTDVVMNGNIADGVYRVVILG